ncbi:putative addiction module component (TIGR02574 family) [Kineosphaera limosa]|uniref:Addiction module component n=1 Tax=Kineosphaera limosa NBRC 100340 TaxID=1184609 RepID=K6XCC3_9MICO|nr:addiction module protein [Kineosphaera limosa]NYE01748.1 putative addiction module component (TIGR02574 family) [Kineosphaera limosa]GAB96454.1 hypothetical protein KILIM_039_00280 [Kineosphaera limosa NBRC 100340]
MTLTASEFYEAGLALPPSVRKDVALRLLDSIEAPESATPSTVDDSWTSEIELRIDDILSGTVETVPHEDVVARLAERRASRRAARRQS